MLYSCEGGQRDFILFLQNQRQHRTWYIQKDVLPYGAGAVFLRGSACVSTEGALLHAPCTPIESGGGRRERGRGREGGREMGTENRGVVVTEAGSYLRLIDSCVTQLKAQGPSRTCNESKSGEEEDRGRQRGRDRERERVCACV